MHFETDGGDADIINELFHQYDDDLESWDKLGKFIQKIRKVGGETWKEKKKKRTDIIWLGN